MSIITQILIGFALAASLVAGLFWFKYDHAIAENAILSGNNATLLLAKADTEKALAQLERERVIAEEILSEVIRDREILQRVKRTVITKIREIEVPANAPASEKCINLAVHPVIDNQLKRLWNDPDGSDSTRD